MSTILIGGSGFLGPAFLESDEDMISVGRSKLPYFLKNKHVHIAGDYAFSDLDNLKFNKVIFLIGSSDHEILNNHPTMAFEKNVLPLMRFFHYLESRNRKVDKIITFTTMLQYDSQKMKIPVNELQPMAPTKNNYIMSKFCAELVSEKYRKMFSIIDVRISNVYGPTRLYRPDIVPSLAWKLIEDGAANVWTKKPIRDFIYVKDAVSAVQSLLKSDYSGAVNLGSGEGNSVGKICKIFQDITGTEIGDLNKKVPGHQHFVQDISLIKKLTGWKPQYSLEEGLSETYSSMKVFYENREGPINSF